HQHDTEEDIELHLVTITLSRRRIAINIAGSYSMFTTYRSQHLASLSDKQILLKIFVSLAEVGLPDSQPNVTPIRFRLVVRQLFFLQLIADNCVLHDLLAELSAFRSQIKDLSSSRAAK